MRDAAETRLLPLPFGNHRAQVDHDPDRLAQQISRAVPLRDLSACRSPRPFVHRSFHVRAAQLAITAAAHTPVCGANHSHSRAVVTFTTLGRKSFRIGGQIYRAEAGRSALFLPGEDYSLETTFCSGAMFTLCPRELASVATSMAGPESGLLFAPMQQPLEFLEGYPQQARILSLLRRSLQLIDLATPGDPELPEELGLDDKLKRLIALLVYPQLMLAPGVELPPSSRSQRIAFEDLLASIREEVLAPWTLSRMERHASLGRAQLLQLFQSQFGCGPLAWVRHQRLGWARQRLDGGQPIGLGELARQCGYLSPQSFREDFEAKFSLSPEAIQPDLGP